jgi:endonuclease/exonuclease/phosphatase family metal-dependent hydrolase
MLILETCSDLPPVSVAQRHHIAEGPTERQEHQALVASVPAFERVELAEPPTPAPPPARSARVAFWNAERCKYPAPSAELLRGRAADVTLLCEMDLGMVRSGQSHTTRQLAADIGQGYVFAVEYLELGLGDIRERSWHAGAENSHGMHGAAIVSPCRLHRPALIRLETSGDWFDGGRGERRVGGRIALAATVSVGGTDVTFVSIHFESHSDPEHRTEQMRTVLAAIDEYALDAPVIMGGDFNTNSVAHDELDGPLGKVALLTTDSERFIDPVHHEPLFGVAAAAGYDWADSNTRQATQRTRPDGTPRPPLGRLDWFFTRGLTVADPLTVPAIDKDGMAISDHDLLQVKISVNSATPHA